MFCSSFDGMTMCGCTDNDRKMADAIISSWETRLMDYAAKMPGRKILNHCTGDCAQCNVIVLLQSGDIAMLYPGNVWLKTKQAISEKIEELNLDSCNKGNFSDIILAYYVID